MTYIVSLLCILNDLYCVTTMYTKYKNVKKLLPESKIILS